MSGVGMHVAGNNKYVQQKGRPGQQTAQCLQNFHCCTHKVSLPDNDNLF